MATYVLTAPGITRSSGKCCATAEIGASSPAPPLAVQATRNQVSTSAHCATASSASRMPCSLRFAVAGDTPSRCTNVAAYLHGITWVMRGHTTSVSGTSGPNGPMNPPGSAVSRWSHIVASVGTRTPAFPTREKRVLSSTATVVA